MNADNDELVHQLLHIAQQQIGIVYSAVFGHIVDYFPDTHTVTVLLVGFANESGFCPVTGQIPLGTPWSGNGWGMQVAPQGGATQLRPSLGESCLVLVLDRESFQTAVGAMLFGGFGRTPDPALQNGEMIMKHSQGSLLKFHNSGELEVTLSAPQAPLNISVNGDASIAASGKINLGSPGGALQALLNATAATLFNGHTHTTPNGTSSPPLQQMGSSEETQVVLAE